MASTGYTLTAVSPEDAQRGSGVYILDRERKPIYTLRYKDIFAYTSSSLIWLPNNRDSLSSRLTDYLEMVSTGLGYHSSSQNVKLRFQSVFLDSKSEITPLVHDPSYANPSSLILYSTLQGTSHDQNTGHVTRTFFYSNNQAHWHRVYETERGSTGFTYARQMGLFEEGDRRFNCIIVTQVPIASPYRYPPSIHLGSVEHGVISKLPEKLERDPTREIDVTITFYVTIKNKEPNAENIETATSILKKMYGMCRIRV